MYHPKQVLTKDGYIKYLSCLENIDDGIYYITNHIDDLHLGALDAKQQDLWYQFVSAWEQLRPILEDGDGEIEE